MDKSTTLPANGYTTFLTAIPGTQKLFFMTDKKISKEIITKSTAQFIEEKDAMPEVPINSVDNKPLSWFIAHLNKVIYAASVGGFNGFVKITNRVQANYFHVRAQKAGYKFLLVRDREQQRFMPDNYPMIETVDPETSQFFWKWLGGNNDRA